VKRPKLEKIVRSVAFPVEQSGQDTTRSSYERFAIPYTFKPRLSFTEAVVAAGGAFLRILLGSILFGVWGAYTLLAFNAVKNVFLRGLVLLALIALFAVSLALLMMAITALVRRVWPQNQQQS
jgi:hypothetical protein